MLATPVLWPSISVEHAAFVICIIQRDRASLELDLYLLFALNAGDVISRQQDASA